MPRQTNMALPGAVMPPPTAPINASAYVLGSTARNPKRSIANPIAAAPTSPYILYSEVTVATDFQSMWSTSLNTVVLQDDHWPMNEKLAMKAHHNRTVVYLRPSPSNAAIRPWPRDASCGAVAAYWGVAGSSVGSNCSRRRGNLGSALFRRTMKRGDSGNQGTTIGRMT